jgi:hypothetical protein
MAAPTIPPGSQPATQPITPSPLGPTAVQTLDQSVTATQPQVQNLQRLEWQLNGDLNRGVLVLPMDINVAAQVVVEIQGFGAPDGNWIVEDHTLSFYSSSDAVSELSLRKTQDIAALYNVPVSTPQTATQGPAAQPGVQSPGGGA